MLLARRLAALCFVASFCLTASCEEAVPTLSYEIVGASPHDVLAYTQGLLFHDGHLYESAGRYGQSWLRKLDAETGEVLLEAVVDSAYFAEGLARVGNELIQLTWKAGQAFVYDLATFEVLRTYTYSGEGWGLCHDGQALYMSDGSSRITIRDPRSFDVTGEITVRANDFPVHQLNELECVGDHIFANVYQTDRILQIDKRSGEVVGELDGFAISVAGGRPADPAAVLNGIAFVEGRDIFLVTGKFWPKLLAIRINGT